MQEFDIAELEKFDGNNGRPVYVAHKGKVYDVSNSKLWKNGLHMKRHHAGNDLTVDIQGAPHEPDVLERYPLIGTLKKESTEAAELEIPRSLAWLLEKVPMLRRHPHPMTVHFPIVFSFSTTIFNILYLITGIKSLEITALHSLGAGILFTVVAIVTGLYTWWLSRPDNYLHLAFEGTACDGIHPGSQSYLFAAYFVPVSDRDRYRLVWGVFNLPCRKRLKLVSKHSSFGPGLRCGSAQNAHILPCMLRF
jgi:predicted heme/steroid binding protein